MTKRLREIAPGLVLLISLAAITNGCGGLGGRQDPANPDTNSSSPATVGFESNRAPDSATGSRDSNQTVGAGPQEAVSESGQSGWMMQQGPWGLSNGLWLNLVALLLGGTGTVWSALNSEASRTLSNRLSRNLHNHQNVLEAHERRVNKASNSIEDLQGRLTSLSASYQQLQRETTTLATNIELQRKQISAAQVRRSEPGFPLAFPETTYQQQVPKPQVPLPEQQLAELTAAINRGDRQAIRAAMRAQLNITRASENAIVTGRLNETALEEVSAGGSYWLTQIGEGVWLYPTELTLKGFAHEQPSKGIFHFNQQAISSPQVMTPARLITNGSNWQIADLGSIAVPG